MLEPLMKDTKPTLWDPKLSRFCVHSLLTATCVHPAAPPEFDPGLIINYLVVEGASPSLILPCSGTGDPRPDLHWLRGSTVLPTGINEMVGLSLSLCPPHTDFFSIV